MTKLCYLIFIVLLLTGCKAARKATAETASSTDSSSAATLVESRKDTAAVSLAIKEQSKDRSFERTIEFDSSGVVRKIHEVAKGLSLKKSTVQTATQAASVQLSQQTQTAIKTDTVASKSSDVSSSLKIPTSKIDWILWVSGAIVTVISLLIKIKKKK